MLFIKSLRDEHKIIPKECDYEIANAMFKTGRAAMIINGDWSWGDYKNIVNNLHEGIVILDSSFNITFTNIFFSNLIDYPLKKIIGQSFLDLLDLKDTNLLKSHLKNC